MYQRIAGLASPSRSPATESGNGESGRPVNMTLRTHHGPAASRAATPPAAVQARRRGCQNERPRSSGSTSTIASTSGAAKILIPNATPSAIIAIRSACGRSRCDPDSTSTQAATAASAKALSTYRLPTARAAAGRASTYAAETQREDSRSPNWPPSANTANPSSSQTSASARPAARSPANGNMAQAVSTSPPPR